MQDNILSANVQELVSPQINLFKLGKTDIFSRYFYVQKHLNSKGAVQ